VRSYSSAAQEFEDVDGGTLELATAPSFSSSSDDGRYDDDRSLKLIVWSTGSMSLRRPLLFRDRFLAGSSALALVLLVLVLRVEPDSLMLRCALDSTAAPSLLVETVSFERL